VNRRLRDLLRAVVIAAGVAATVAGAFAFRWEDWPIYLAFVLLSGVLFVPAVEILPSLTMPLPGLAVCIGFLYVGGLPIILIRNLAPPFFAQLVRIALPVRWLARVPQLGPWWGGNYFTAALASLDRAAVAVDWALFSTGLAIRWWIAAALVPSGRPAGHPLAIAAGEAGGYLFWGILSFLPIASFRPIYAWQAPGGPSGLRAVYQDLGLIMILGLTPFVFLIAYGYEAHGLGGAVVWSLAALGLHFVLQRLTERRNVVEEQNRRLEALNRELEHRERLSAIGKMSSVVSHQMLQQLGVIGLHADLIRHGEGEPATVAAEAKENAVAIEGALADLNRVLTDLLVFSRDLRLNLYEHALRPLLEECVAACARAALARHVRLRLECPPELTVVLDKLKMKQAILNVLQNAIEASPAGGEVAIAGAAADGFAEIRITDQGPGIPPADREAVFTPFFTRKEQGTGLGLAIAREFTEAHGGCITVEGGDGGGARFLFRLPLKPVAGRD
jgi:signal transduction histidine kinase